MLGATMSGVKLPAFVIWKGVPNGRVWMEVRGVQFPRDMIKHTVQPRGWMDSSTYKQWVAEVVAPYFNGRPGCILQDNFSVHLKQSNITTLNNIGVDVDYILAGYTPILEVMDKGVFKPFKGYLQEEQLWWIVVQPQGHKPTRLDVARWIQAACQKVTIETITNTWQSINLHPFNNP